MKFFKLFVISFLVNIFVLGQNGEKTIIAETGYFEFHSDYWINLHHFLFQKAGRSQEKKLKEDGYQLLEINEAAVYKGLDTEQSKKLEEAVEYYQKNIVNKDLIRQLGKERVWLQKQNADNRITDTLFSKAYTKVLNQASEVYKTTFWPLHMKQNELVIERHLPIVKKMEGYYFSKITKLALQDWPSKTKVRVDLTAYANYAGAYTPTRPYFNLIISSLDPGTENTGFIETLFHEGTHLIFLYGGPFRSGISEIFDQEGFKMEYPGHLWHASMFYLCGRVVQDELEKLGIDNHQLTMDERNIYTRYNSEEFRRILELYYQGKSDFETTIIRLLDDLNDK